MDIAVWEECNVNVCSMNHNIITMRSTLNCSNFSALDVGSIDVSKSGSSTGWLETGSTVQSSAVDNNSQCICMKTVMVTVAVCNRNKTVFIEVSLVWNNRSKNWAADKQFMFISSNGDNLSNNYSWSILNLTIFDTVNKFVFSKHLMRICMIILTIVFKKFEVSQNTIRGAQGLLDKQDGGVNNIELYLIWRLYLGSMLKMFWKCL